MRTPESQGRRRAGLWLGAVALTGVGALAAAWSGCTVTKDNYKTLSFFFDGVPKPRDSTGPGAGGIAEAVAAVIVHRPYAEEKCDACHRTRFRPSRNDASACRECHSGVETAHERMHGPVVSGACLWCHAPHESKHAALLRDRDRKVCGQCHTPGLLESTRVPAHADEARACLECHSGHGGREPYLLKPGAAERP